MTTPCGQPMPHPFASGRRTVRCGDHVRAEPRKHRCLKQTVGYPGPCAECGDPIETRCRRCEPGRWCIDGGTRHSWQARGLDVVPVRGRDELRRVRGCVWCGAERHLPLKRLSLGRVQ